MILATCLIVCGVLAVAMCAAWVQWTRFLAADPWEVQ